MILALNILSISAQMHSSEADGHNSVYSDAIQLAQCSLYRQNILEHHAGADKNYRELISESDPTRLASGGAQSVWWYRSKF